MKHIINLSFLSLLLILCFSINANAQNAGKIEGKVFDKKSNEPLIGVTIVLDGTSKGAVTDVEGRYTIPATAGTYKIVFQYMGYQKKEITDVVIKNGNIITLDAALEDASKSIKEVVVTGSSIKKESINSLITFQKNTNTVASVISAEAIKRSPDRNTSEVLKRLPGTSIQEGKYLIVRGLADRYNQATVNGALLSSTEPDRKTFSFDLFPSSMVDNIIINKAATPDMPGEFAGGLVQVNTKDIPSNDFFNIQLGSGFNSQTIGKDFYTYKGGKWDWLGIDDGTRGLPKGFPGRKGFENIRDVNLRNEWAKKMPNSWGTYTKNAPLNTNLQMTGGINGKLFGKSLGVVLALSYNKQNRITDFTRTFFNQTDAKERTLDLKDTRYSEEVLWGALANISLKLNDNNKISLKNLYNVNGQDFTTLRTGRNFDAQVDLRSHELAFKSTRYLTSQLIGEHYLPSSKLKLRWNANIANLFQYQPNQRRLTYENAGSSGDGLYHAQLQTALPTQGSGSIFYATLDDNIYGFNTDISRQIKMFGQQQTFKIGYFYQKKDRKFISRPLGIVGTNSQLDILPADKIFAPENFRPGGWALSELTDKDYEYSADGALHAGFLYLDNNFGSNLRAVWGVRYENYNQNLLGYQSNIPVTVKTQVGDFLPSVNLTYRLNEKSNLRLSGSQTVIRPEFRELSPFSYFDFDQNAAIQGNPKLERTKVTNIDVRYEIYPRAGEVISIGGFYKYFKNPIEMGFNETGVNTISFSYLNFPKATSYGIEFEIRKRLDFTPALKNFTFFSNLAYIYNKVESAKDVNKADISRPMQGQSPYVINAGLQYDHKSGLNATFLFNQIGRRIFSVGDEDRRHIWEAPRAILDFQIAKKFAKEMIEVKLTAGDILNQVANYYQDRDTNKRYNADTDFLRFSRKPGTNYSISVGFNLSRNSAK